MLTYINFSLYCLKYDLANTTNCLHELIIVVRLIEHGRSKMNVAIEIDYLFQGKPFKLTTDSEQLGVTYLDPLDQTTYVRQVIDLLIETHYQDNDSVAVNVGTIRAVVNGDTKPNAYTNSEYAHLFNLEQVIVHIQGYCFPLAA